MSVYMCVCAESRWEWAWIDIVLRIIDQSLICSTFGGLQKWLKFLSDLPLKKLTHFWGDTSITTTL